METTVQNNNMIANLYPLTKFYLAIALASAGVFLPGLWAKLTFFILINILAASSGIYKTFLKRVSASIGVLFIILIVIQTLFYPGKDILFTVWIFSAKMEGFMFALNLGLNLLCVGGALIWFFAVTKEKDFILSLQKKGLNAHASYVVLSTLQMVPVLKKKSQTIMDAQRARGVETEGGILIRAKVFIPIMVPLVLSSISGIEERALTLEARGFSIKTKPTHLYDIEERPIDKKINILIIVGLVLVVAGRVALWLI